MALLAAGRAAAAGDGRAARAPLGGRRGAEPRLEGQCVRCARVGRAAAPSVDRVRRAPLAVVRRLGGRGGRHVRGRAAAGGAGPAPRPERRAAAVRQGHGAVPRRGRQVLQRRPAGADRVRPGAERAPAAPERPARGHALHAGGRTGAVHLCDAPLAGGAPRRRRHRSRAPSQAGEHPLRVPRPGDVILQLRGRRRRQRNSQAAVRARVGRVAPLPLIMARHTHSLMIVHRSVCRRARREEQSFADGGRPVTVQLA